MLPEMPRSGPWTCEGDDVVAARVVPDDRVAAEISQSPRSRQVQGVRAIRQAVQHLERGLVGRAIVRQESRVVPRPVGRLDEDLGNRRLVQCFERLESELLDIDRLRELHGELRGRLVEHLAA